MYLFAIHLEILHIAVVSESFIYTTTALPLCETAEAKLMRFIRLKEVIYMTGLSRSTIYRRMDEGTFPQKRSLGGRAVAWLESDVIGWMENILSQND